MSVDFDQEDFDAFMEEAEAHLAMLETGLLGLEEAHHATPSLDLLGEMFRAAHSIKGSSGLLGLKKVSSLTHQMEGLLDALRSSRMPWSDRVAEVLFEAVDALRTLLVEGADPKLDIAAPIANLEDLLESPLAPAPVPAGAAGASAAQGVAVPPAFAGKLGPRELDALARAAGEGRFVYEVDLDLRDCRWLDDQVDHAVVEKLRTLTRVLAIASDPEFPPQGHPDPFPVKGAALVVTSADPAIMRMLLPVASGAIRELPGPGIAPALEPLAPMVEAAGPAFQAEPRDDDQPGTQAEPAMPPPGPEPTVGGPAGTRKAAGGHTIRVGVERLDHLMDVVGELVVANTRLSALGGELEARYDRDPATIALGETLAGVNRLMAELQQVVMAIRMVPVERVFSKFPRLVRDLSRTLGKEIRLEISGEDTELDKTLIEELEDPLVHLLRNAADHGVEPPAERLAKGKPADGTLKLWAGREGNRIVIGIEDDGAGIDPQRVLRKAIAQGLASPDATYTDGEILQFIMHPGFSTAEQVTDVSGRGVGMDVVNQNIRRLKGSLHIQSVPGSGSRFLIKLPLTLAITKALLIRVGAATFAVPIDVIRESIRVRPEDVRTVNQREVILLRDQVVPLVRVGSLLGVPSRPGRTMPVVVVGDDERPVGLVVDSLEGELDIVIKSLGDFLGELPGIAGASILGDGRVALVLDTPTLAAASPPVGGAAAR